MLTYRRPIRAMLLTLALLPSSSTTGVGQPPARNYPYQELTGKVEEFRFTRNWRSYYWRQDFTMLVRDDAGKLHRIISREPTPWSGHRLGTTYPGLAVEWTSQPRVQIIGVRAIDRIPADFYDLKLDPDQTITAFIVRVETKAQGKEGTTWKDFFINNWFHRWGADTDKQVLKHYARPEKNYGIYGYLGGTVAPFGKEGQALLQKYPDAHIFHGQVQAAKNDVGYEVRVLHLLGRSKKTQKYEIFYGDPAEVRKLEGTPPPEAGKK